MYLRVMLNHFATCCVQQHSRCYLRLQYLQEHFVLGYNLFRNCCIQGWERKEFLCSYWIVKHLKCLCFASTILNHLFIILYKEMLFFWKIYCLLLLFLRTRGFFGVFVSRGLRQNVCGEFESGWSILLAVTVPLTSRN